MPEPLRQIYLALFALRRIELVTIDPVHAKQLGIRPGQAFKVVAIAAPRMTMLLIGFAWNTAIIALFLCAAVYKLSPGDYAAMIGPTLVLGLHATLRMGWKVRERVAIQAKWPVPVARQKQWFLACAAFIGFLTGFFAAYWFLQSLSASIQRPTAVTASVVVGVIEMIRNATRIGGTFEIPDFNLSDHITYVPRNDPSPRINS